MTDTDRERLERARQHPACQAALAREASDYFWPAMLLGLFYLLIPLLMALPFVLMTDATGEALFLGLFMTFEVIWAIPFVVVAMRAYRLRGLPPRQLLGIVEGRAHRQPGTWVTLQPLDGDPVDLRLRLKAYLESTGGGVGPGSIGVALCRGDQLLEWVPVPDAAPTPADVAPAPDAPTPASDDAPAPSPTRA
jgi:hypothetical protein